MQNIVKTVLFSFTSTSAKIIVLLFSLFLTGPLAVSEILMLTVSAFTDLLIGIGFAREEPDPFSTNEKQKKIHIMSLKHLLKGFMVFGAIEASAVLCTYFVSM